MKFPTSPTSTIIYIDTNKLSETIRVLEQAGFTIVFDSFLLVRGYVLAASRGDENYLVDSYELGHILHYGASYLQGFRSEKYHTPNRPLQVRLHAYAERVMVALILQVQSAGMGERNVVLFQAAATLGSLLHWNVFDEQTVWLRLLGQSTLPINEQRSTIRSGLKRGQTRPRPLLEEW